MKITASVLISLILLVSGKASGENLSPNSVTAADVYGQLQKAVDLTKLRLREYRVQGTTPLRSSSLATRKLIFEPGSTLFIPDDLLDSPIYLLADEIELQGDANIAWGKRDETMPPPSRLKAPDGVWGRGEGANGTDGAPGQAGNVGFPGRSGPSLIIFAKKIGPTPGHLKIDLSGEAGGPGGRGQDGGRGGDGARGVSASQSLFDCKRGPGAGGNGGNGGDGGPAGPGGSGGAGGDLLLVGLEPDDVTKLQVTSEGGKGGPRGEVGAPGQPGAGGSEGELALPYCGSAHRLGQPGRPGSPSREQSADGVAGPDGRLQVVAPDDPVIDAIFGPN